MSCNEKLKYTCGQRQNARCTFYEVDLPSWSLLLTEDCVTIEETNKELYDEVTVIKNFLDFDNLTEDCITYTYVDSENKKLSEVINPITLELCALKSMFESQGTDAICNISIIDCGIDTKCLDDICNTGLDTIGELLQALVDKVCDLDAQVNP